MSINRIPQSNNNTSDCLLNPWPNMFDEQAIPLCIESIFCENINLQRLDKEAAHFQLNRVYPVLSGIKLKVLCP